MIFHDLASTALSKAADASLSADTKDELNRIEFYMALVRLAIQLCARSRRRPASASRRPRCL